ncbi:MAG TPA: FecR domain-containing protein [Myxococcaceae bacterium]|nr:FecR domain-containing protein [Myxococcaceae bacterium]
MRLPTLKPLLLIAGLSVLGACQDAPAPVPPVTADEPAVPPRGHLSDFTGKVTIKRADADAWIPATRGMALSADDKVATAAQASATITFAGGGTVTLGENALVGLSEPRALHQDRPTDVTVHRGHVEAVLTQPDRQSLSVDTPAAQISAGREVVFQ